MTSSEPEVRVSLVAQKWAPEFAGAAMRFKQYLPGLRERGIEMDVLCLTAPGDDRSGGLSRWKELEIGQALPAEVLEGVSVRRVRLPPGRSLRRNALFRRAVSRHLGTSGARVAQYLTMEPLRTFRGSGLRQAGTKGVFTGTQMWEFSDNPLKRVLQRRWIRYPLDKLDHVVVSSTVMRDFYRSLGVQAPMSVVPNGVDLDRFQSADPDQEKRAARSSLGIPMTADLIVFVGSVIHRKGVDLLLEAFARVSAANPRAELLLVGPRGDGKTEQAVAFDAEVDRLVRSSGAGDRIRLAGYAPNVQEYLRAADVFVLPSRREGMGNVVLEAMAMGIPTVLTPYLGLPREFGDPGKQYVLSALEADDLALHMGSLLEDRARRQALAMAGQRWVADHMSMTTAIDAYARIYRGLAEHGAVRTRNREMP